MIGGEIEHETCLFGDRCRCGYRWKCRSDALRKRAITLVCAGAATWTGLNRMVNAIKNDGGFRQPRRISPSMRSRANSIEERVAAIEADIGPIEVVVYNLGAQIGDRALKDTSLKAFETGWRLGTFGLFRLASAVCPLMEARGKGTILVTSATAAMRGNGRSTFSACGRH